MGAEAQGIYSPSFSGIVILSLSLLVMYPIIVDDFGTVGCALKMVQLFGILSDHP